MDPYDNLTQAESGILNEARKLLGDNLADLLLSGLSETTISNRRAFTAQSSTSQQVAVIYQLEMINDSKEGLPNDRDPLILAAMLDLLLERQPLNSTILFRQSNILEKLNWPYNEESQGIVKRAIEKYLMTAFCLIDPTISDADCLLGRYASIGRLLLTYETTSILHLQKKSEQARSIRVQFLPALINDVISKRKYFLGLEFQSLQKLRPIST